MIQFVASRMLRVANAPCSWGVLEFASSPSTLRDPQGRPERSRGTTSLRAGAPPTPAPFNQVLDEIAQTGYAGTELGYWGFMPTDPARLQREVSARNLQLIGAFVPVALANREAHAAGQHTALRTARLMRDAGAADAFIVLSDDNGTVPAREQNAGRLGPEHALTEAQWVTFGAGVEQIARAVREATGLRTVFHPHCGGYVETPTEIDELMRRTDSDLIGLVLDTGHIMYGGGNPVDVLTRHAPRLWHVHFKDCDPAVADQARRNGLGYLAAVRAQLFCELGQGGVNFAAVLAELRRIGYDGWIVVEQDVFPGYGTPADSATRNRRYLVSLGI